MSTEEIRERTERLERRAKIVQSRLMRAVDALDERRHQVQRITKHAKEIAMPTVVATAGIVTLFGLSIACFSTAVRRRRSSTMRDRAADFVRSLDLVPRPSFARLAAEKVALSFLAYAATEVARRATKNVVDGRLLDGRLAVHPALEAHHTELIPT